MLIEIPVTAPTTMPAIPFDWQSAEDQYDAILSSVWLEHEAEAFSPPPDISVSEWADQNRILQAGISRKPGPWRTSYTPYIGPVMDAYKRPGLRHLVLAAGTQLGKTECCYNILGYIIDHEPYSTMMVSPREDDAKMVSRTRVQPMIRDCECLRKKMPAERSKFKTLEMEFPGMFLYMVGANSISGLASKPCRNIIRDEIGKYPDRLGADADPLSKSEERAKSYWDDRKIVDVSSATLINKGILSQLIDCEVIWVIHHPCPHCHELIRLYPTQIVYDDQPGDKYRVAKVRQSARYVCQRCGAEIGNNHRPWMIENFQYVPQQNITFGIKREGENIPLGDLGFVPESEGFWVSSLSSPMLTWGDIAAKFVQALIWRDEKGSTEQLQNVINDWYNEPWLLSVRQSSTEQILQRRVEREPLLVPEWAYAVTAGIDVQKHGFWFSVWAWGKDMRSAMIHYGYLATWLDLWKLMFQTTFAVENSSKRMGIWRAAIDMGGGSDSKWGDDWTKTTEILTWVRENGRGVVYAIKGMSTNNTGLVVRQSVLDKMPGEKGNIIPGGLTTYHLDTDQLKDTLFWRFENGPDDPQQLELHCKTGDDFALHLTAEEKQRDKHGNWSWVRTKKDNHLLDACVYAHGAADFQWMGGVAILEYPLYIAAVDYHIDQDMRPDRMSGENMRNSLQQFQRPGWIRR